MPHANIWIRKEDWEKWNLIENKAELISQAISRSVITPVKKKDGSFKTRQGIEPPQPVPQETDYPTSKPPVSLVEKFNVKRCKKHGTPLTLEGKCLQKGH